MALQKEGEKEALGQEDYASNDSNRLNNNASENKHMTRDSAHGIGEQEGKLCNEESFRVVHGAVPMSSLVIAKNWYIKF